MIGQCWRFAEGLMWRSKVTGMGGARKVRNQMLVVSMRRWLVLVRVRGRVSMMAVSRRTRRRRWEIVGAGVYRRRRCIYAGASGIMLPPSRASTRYRLCLL